MLGRIPLGDQQLIVYEPSDERPRVSENRFGIRAGGVAVFEHRIGHRASDAEAGQQRGRRRIDDPRALAGIVAREDEVRRRMRELRARRSRQRIDGHDLDIGGEHEAAGENHDVVALHTVSAGAHVLGSMRSATARWSANRTALADPDP